MEDIDKAGPVYTAEADHTSFVSFFNLLIYRLTYSDVSLRFEMSC